ncbi:hypothetical protein HPB51_026083 [Rhipicephalus microplus]|uniref:Peroxidase n=1 Tax=Rhipicephalus microplus TaxID=6941 RepID=A0A9J6EE57_RHIMP|nr:hypothetical protein HPB51_026083 [Rhipicephalus microplus]
MERKALSCCFEFRIQGVERDSVIGSPFAPPFQFLAWIRSSVDILKPRRKERECVHYITNGGCPFRTKRAARKESPREDVLKAELALCFEEASRRLLTSSRNPTDGLDANAATASEAKCASSPLCRHRGAKRCDASRPFREADGRCNNVEHPEWGAAGACMRRLLPPAYADGVSSPRVSSRSGRALPSARRVSYTVHPERKVYDGRWSSMMVHFSQFVAHDISATFLVDKEGPEFSENLGTMSSGGSCTFR